MSSREETDAEYFSRRALEENRVAQSARSNKVIAAHRHIAVAYAMRLAEELKMERALDELLIALEAASHYSLETPAPFPVEAATGGAGGGQIAA